MYLLILTFISCGNQDNHDIGFVQQDLFSLPMQSKFEITAGSDLSINLQSIFPDSVIAKKSFIIESLEGAKKIDLRNLARSGNSYVLPGRLFRNSGFHLIYEFPTDEEKPVLKINVLPGKPKGLIETYVGPKSIVVSSIERSLALYLMKDQNCNPILIPEQIEYKIQYPGQEISTIISEIHHFTGQSEILPLEMTGKIRIGLLNQDVSSKENIVNVTSGWPLDFNIKILEYIPFADARNFIQVYSDLITDALGNMVPDGTVVVYHVIEHGNLVSIYRANTNSGIASVMIRNPMKATDWRIYATVYSEQKSNIISLSFRNHISQLPFQYHVEENRIQVGPVVNELGNVVPDGYLARVKLETEDFGILHKDLYLLDGKCNLEIPAIWKNQRMLCSVYCGGLYKQKWIDLTE